MKRTMLTLALIAGTLAVSGCNTIRGAGKDAKSVGHAAEDVVK